MGMRPNGGMARIVEDSTRIQAERRRYGTVQSIGDGTVDVLPDDKTGLVRKARAIGTLTRGMRVVIVNVDGRPEARPA